MIAGKSWDNKILRDLVNINYGKSPANILSSEGNYPVVGTGGIERLGKDFLYDGDSIVLGRKGTIDRVFFITGRFWTIDTAYYLSDFREAFPQWLFYFLQTIDLRQLNEATGVPSLSRELLYKIKVKTPPTPEQEKIAEVLSAIDRAIAQTEAIIAKQQRIKTGLMQDLLTKGIDENGNIRSEATHEFKDSAIGRIPVEWEVRKIGELSYIENGTTPSRENPIFWYEGTIPWLTTGQVHDRFILHSNEFISEYALRLCSLRILPVGTILIAMIGQGLTRGKTAYLGFEASINQNFAAIIPNLLFNSKFLFHYLAFNYEYVRGASQGSNQQALNSSVVSNLKVVCPPLQEQNHIANIIDVYDNCISKEETYLIKQKRQKTGLMQDLLTGKVRVTNLLKEKKPAIP